MKYNKWGTREGHSHNPYALKPVLSAPTSIRPSHYQAVGIIYTAAHQNGMLRHSFATLEGCNLLWHMVAPPRPSPSALPLGPPPFTPLFCFLFLVHPIWFCLPIWLDVWQHNKAQARAGNKFYTVKWKSEFWTSPKFRSWGSVWSLIGPLFRPSVMQPKPVNNSLVMRLTFRTWILDLSVFQIPVVPSGSKSSHVHKCYSSVKYKVFYWITQSY